MRKVIYGGACSLDGFVAGPDGSLDWLHFSDDVRDVVARSWAEADTVLFGRKTWEASAGSGGGGMPGMKSYLFSRTLTRPPGDGVELATGDAGEFVRQLKRQPGKDILVMSGGNLAASLLSAGVVDEVGLNIHPVLLGSGVPAFLDAGRRVRLTLAECRPIHGGCVLVRYTVAG
jgi:dihydrofolate reductase